MTTPLCWHTVRSHHSASAACGLFLIHGWLGSSRDWNGVVRHLPEDYHIVAVDLPGHGNTPQWSSDQLSFSTLCEALATVRRTAFETIRPIVVGYSLGGRIALQLAQTKPELFSGLVLIAAHPGLSSDTLRAARRVADADRAAELASRSFEAFVRLWYTRPPFSSLTTKPDLQEAIIQERLSSPPSSPAPLLTALSLGNQPPPPESLSLPTLLLAGSEDSAYCDTLNQFSNQVGAPLDVVPDAGHALLLEAPSAVAPALIEFSRRLAPTTTFPLLPSE